jgi:diaminopimelate epimerase
MTTAFAKMHGLGNDFMVMEAAADGSVPSAATVKAWADRHTGVGFDQLLLVGSAEAADASYRVFNADGQEVEQCANGARCVARFVAERDHRRELTLASLGGLITARVGKDGEVTISLGEPNFDPASLPFMAEPAQRYHLSVANRDVSFGAVSMGNPHAVVVVDSVDNAPVGILGPGLAQHDCFPRGVNVGFAEIVNAQRVKLRVHERGVGETRACGTGAAAAVAVGRSWGLLDAEVVVELPGGELRISWPGSGKPLGLTGPASWVYRGNLQR